MLKKSLKPAVLGLAVMATVGTMAMMPAAQAASTDIIVANMHNPCNPCAAKNPCAAHNPCAANPCAAKNPCNPCAAKNPCAAHNPCAAKNPCNPCNPCAAKKRM